MNKEQLLVAVVALIAGLLIGYMFFTSKAEKQSGSPLPVGAGSPTDYQARIAEAEKIALNAKVQRPGVCNAMETLLVHQDVAETFIPRIAAAMRACTTQDAASADGIATGSVMNPPRPVTNPVVKFLAVSHLMSAATRASS